MKKDIYNPKTLIIIFDFALFQIHYSNKLLLF